MDIPYAVIQLEFFSKPTSLAELPERFDQSYNRNIQARPPCCEKRLDFAAANM
jgi:hypothetical protein